MKYIGQSKELEIRRRKHFSKSSNIYLRNAIEKYGKENFEWEILEYVDIENLTEKEQFYLDKYDFDILYNFLPKAASPIGYKKPWAKCNTLPVYQLDIETGNLINKWDNANIAAYTLNISCKNIMNVCDKRSKSCQGYFWSFKENDTVPYIKSNSRIQRIKIEKICPKTNKILEVFDSISEASKICKVNSGHISEVCKGKRRIAGKFIWRYVDNIIREQTNKAQIVIQLDTHGNIINIFDSVFKASKATNIAYTTIKMICKGVQKQQKGYDFYYAFT